MPDESQFPELVRSLRTLGAARDPATEAAHDAIFTPLIEARARAARTDQKNVVDVVRGASLGDQIERGVVEAAVYGAESSAVARARASIARELIEPVRAALDTLDARASAAHGAAVGSPEWDAWLGALRRVFGSADDACIKLAGLLAIPARSSEQSRWFGSRSQ
jgi:hypothetical protein